MRYLLLVLDMQMCEVLCLCVGYVLNIQVVVRLVRVCRCGCGIWGSGSVGVGRGLIRLSVLRMY